MKTRLQKTWLMSTVHATFLGCWSIFSGEFAEQNWFGCLNIFSLREVCVRVFAHDKTSGVERRRMLGRCPSFCVAANCAHRLIKYRHWNVGCSRVKAGVLHPMKTRLVERGGGRERERGRERVRQWERERQGEGGKERFRFRLRPTFLPIDWGCTQSPMLTICPCLSAQKCAQIINNNNTGDFYGA